MSIFPHRRLGDLIEEVSDRNHSLQCTNVYSVTNSQGFVPSEDYFNKKVFSKDLSNYKLVRHGMFAYNPSRINVGSIAWLRDMPCVAVSPLYVIFRIKGADVLPAWIAYFLRSDIGRAQIRGLTSGSVRDSLKYSALERIEIPIAPIEDQQRILANLATLDKSIRLCEILLEKMDELVKSQFVEMFGDPILNTHGWQKVSLSALAEIKIGPFGSLLHREDYIVGGHPVVNPSHVHDGNIVIDEKLTISETKYKELSAYHLFENDVVLGRRGEMGRCAVVQTSGLLCGTGSMIIRTLGEVRADFLQKIISFPSFKKMLEDMAVGQTMPNLNVPIISRLEIIKPPNEVQNAYYAFVEQVDKSKLVLRQLLEKQQTLKAALMQEYFS